jgi:hypothetical protein
MLYCCYMEISHLHQAEIATQVAVAEQDPFDAMMRAEFGQDFGTHLGAPAMEGSVQFTPEEIDAQVADFAGELNRMEATSESDEANGMSAFDRDFLGANGMSMRAMTESELAQVAANEQRARDAVANAFQEHAFAQMTQTLKKNEKDEFND